MGACKTKHSGSVKKRAKGLLGEDKGEASVDEIAQVCQQLVVVFGCQVTPFEVGVRLLWPVRQQVVSPSLQKEINRPCMM